MSVLSVKVGCNLL